MSFMESLDLNALKLSITAIQSRKSSSEIEIRKRAFFTMIDDTLNNISPNKFADKINDCIQKMIKISDDDSDDDSDDSNLYSFLLCEIPLIKAELNYCFTQELYSFQHDYFWGCVRHDSSIEGSIDCSLCKSVRNIHLEKYIYNYIKQIFHKLNITFHVDIDYYCSSSNGDVLEIKIYIDKIEKD